MFVVGLTGGIGSGKTTVANLLAARGAHVIDCDGLGRVVAEPDGRAYAGMVERFGPGIVAPDGRIDRPALAKIVFNDAAALADLTADLCSIARGFLGSYLDARRVPFTRP